MVPVPSRKALSPFFAFCIVTSLFIGWSLLLPETSSSVSANGIPTLYPGYGTATIDGNIDPTEWANADSLSLPTSRGDLTGTLYVMQDAVNLYLGFVINDDELTIGEKYGVHSDEVLWEFDDDNSGELFDIDENKAAVFAVDPWYWDAHFYNETGSSISDVSTGGTTDGIGRMSRQGDNNHFELSFPLCSGDEYDFCLHPNDILGLRIEYFDMYPVDDEVGFDVHLFPGQSTTSLVPIQIASWYQVFLPFVLK